MSAKTYVATSIAIGVVFVLMIKIYSDPGPNSAGVMERQSGGGIVRQDTQQLTETLRHIIAQRNNVSREMNLKQQKIGQLECDVRLIT